MNIAKLPFETPKYRLIALWLSITLSQVLFKIYQRPGEMVSILVITLIVLGAMLTVITLFSKLNQSTSF